MTEASTHISGGALDLVVENVRCFSGRHVAPLKPLTLLVGENSAGKSTLIAMTKIAIDAMASWGPVDFNQEPFHLGAFGDIVSSIGGKRHQSFNLGFLIKPLNLGLLSDGSRPDVEVKMEFTGRDGITTADRWEVRWGPYALFYANHPSDGTKRQLIVKGPATQVATAGTHSSLFSSILSLGQHLKFLLMIAEQDKQGQFWEKAPRIDKNDTNVIDKVLECISKAFENGPPLAIAPIRTKPTRTYDPLKARQNPEGSHVPTTLAELTLAPQRSRASKHVLEALNKYGEAAGLFDSLSVEQFETNRGNQNGFDASLPFQIHVGMGAGLRHNLVDVGYGVGQVLPVLVDAIMNPQKLLLLQQPEVHLHPRAQAELGTFLCRLTESRGSSPIIVETHSDYLIDRVRMEVRDKKMRVDDVSILYCSRTAEGASIYPISLDVEGNLLNAPVGYRHFFLEEERRFLWGD